MARINLLPWREERREQRQKKFYFTLGLATLVASMILYFAVSFVDNMLVEQSQRNNFLNREIALLDVKIQKISSLEIEKAKLLAQMDVIQSLQASRPKAVKIFESIVKTMPEGIYLEKVDRKGQFLDINGVAESNARVSVFMRNIDNDPEFNQSTLTILQRSSSADMSIIRFNLKVSESKQGSK